MLFGGITLELIQSPGAMPMGEGNVPHFAILVDDLDAAAAEIRAAGVLIHLVLCFVQGDKYGSI